MKRRAFLTMLGAAAATPLLPIDRAEGTPARHALPRNYIPYDARPYYHPSVLRAEHVDPLIWPAVQRINQSGWVWTLESCQGHRGNDAWSDCPLLRLAVHHGQAARMLGLLHRAAPAHLSYGGEQIQTGPERTRLEFQRHVEPPLPGWYETRVRVLGPHGISVLDRFAEAVNTGRVSG